MCETEQELFNECQRGNFKQVNSLIEKGVDCNITSESKDGKEMSALCVAAFEGHLEVVKALSKHSNLNYRCKQGETALFLAAQQGHVKIVQFLLSAGAELVYTARPGEKTLYKNWEVFTQTLHHAYPKDVNHPSNACYKSVAQALVDFNADSSRPSVLYEALFCELTVFANPIAVYAVGFYAALSPPQTAAVFCEENFLSALCRAYHSSRSRDFINTVYTLLDTSKLRQKDVAQSVTKVFNWADLLRRLAEEQQKPAAGQKKEMIDVIACSVVLMKILQILISNFNVRSELLEQFGPFTADDMARVGRLMKNLIEYDGPNEASNLNHVQVHTDLKPNTWKILFFLLKYLLRSGQDACVARLLLRSSTSTEFEKKVLLTSLDDDLSLAHMLLDFGVAFNGECLVRSIKCGHLDLVNRFKADRELLFCKELEEILRQPLLTKNSSNRNMRRCLKVVKGQRQSMEEERKKFEAELLSDPVPANKGKKKKARGKNRKSKPTNGTEMHSCEEIEEETEEDHVLNSEEPQLDPKAKFCESEKESTFGYTNNHDSHIGKQDGSKSRKKKGKKKHSGRKAPSSNPKQDEVKTIAEDPQQELNALKLKHITLQNRYNDVAVTTARRRRQSSSSSDCSLGSGSRKSVHFSHQLVTYENPNKKDRVPFKHHGNRKPIMSSLKKTMSFANDPLISEAYRTNPLGYESEIFNADCFGYSDSDIPWVPVSPRWAPRYEDLSEMDVSALKQLKWTNLDGLEKTVYICDDQKHLLVGAGPDYSNVFLSLTSEGHEVAVKRVNVKRAPLLAQKEITSRLVELPDHTGINNYTAVIKDKTQCFLIQSVGEFSLEQILRRKMSALTGTPHVLCRQLVEGLSFLHQNDILHMAIKPNNVFVDSVGNLRLADYGIHCRKASANQKHTLGPTSESMCWMPREVLSQDGASDFSTSSDIASLGMVMHYIITGGNHPFGDPYTVPGVCICNIGRGAYNLKSITDPVAHHLLRNMILKEPEKRICMEDILRHPYFWSDEQKTKFVNVLTEIALSSSAVMQQLKSVENEIMSSYACQEKLVDVADVFRISVRGMLTLLYDCAHNDDLYAQCTVDAEREKHPSPVQYFISCFPGLLLHTYKLFTIEELEKSAADNTLTSPPSSPDDDASVDFNNVETASCSDLSDVTEDQHSNDSAYPTPHHTSGQIMTIPSACNKVETPLEKPVSVKEEASEKTFLVTAATSSSHRDRKNPSLCLAPAAVSTPKPGEMEAIQPDLMSPEASECIMLNEENDWTPQSSSSDQELDPPTKTTTNLAKLPSDANTYAESASPDDWIEIGSPLEELASKAHPLEILKSGSASSTPSSGGSVDVYFDFGSYNEAESVNNNSNNNSKVAVKASNFGQQPAQMPLTWTDIDELD